MTSLYSHDIILVLFLFWWIIKQDYKKKYLVTGDPGASLIINHVSLTTMLCENKNI